MKRLAVYLVATVSVWLMMGATFAGGIDSNLEDVMAGADEQEIVSALVYLWDQVDVDGLNAEFKRQRAPYSQRHEVVVRSLQELAAATQDNVVNQLTAMQKAGTVESFHAFWIANCIRVDATSAAIEAIAQHEDVQWVYLNYEIELIGPVGGVPTASAPLDPPHERTPEVGLVAVRAPEVWAMGFTGEGILVASLDTGVDGDHPALASRWRGVADPRYVGHPDWAWFDPVTSTTFPASFGAHGTHTMGSVCGGAPGDEVGVAPGVQWIHAAVIDRVDIPTTVADSILAFEWMVDPDGNPVTNWDVPAVCSNSWGVTTGHGYPECDETFWSYLDACEAAGTLILFSAGNEGSGGLRRPSDRATDEFRTCAVAAVDANDPSWPIASFSSRGPTYCTPGGSSAIKPDISAPGVNVRSAVPGGGYESSGWSGTSMASPHVNGVVALMREACPELSIEDIKQIIYDTAHDLGSSGEDNDYGYGMVDAYEAVITALDWCGESPPRVTNGYYETPVDVAVTTTLEASDHDGGPFPISYKITALPATGHTLTDVGASYVITAGDLPYTLVDNGNEVLYSPTGGFYGNDTFEFVASDGGTPPDGGDSETGTMTILVLFGPPTITTTALPDGYLGYAYGPAVLQADQGQPDLEWSLISDEYAEIDLEDNFFQTTGFARGWNSDDNSWNYTLPFAFPYFDETFTSVWVCSNGFIDFGSSSSPWTNSDADLIANQRIAPLWDDLRTDQGGGDDIYINELAPGQVTIRWQAVTYASPNAPVNVSVTLYDDGRIRFHYGEENTPITPTVGISKGDGSAYYLSQYNNASDLGSVDSLEFIQPIPLPDGLVLDPNGTVSGVPTEFGEFGPRFRVIDSLGRSDLQQVTLTIHEETPPCIWDLSGNETVDPVDVGIAKEKYGCTVGGGDPVCDQADVSGNGVVDPVDVGVIKQHYGPCP